MQSTLTHTRFIQQELAVFLPTHSSFILEGHSRAVVLPDMAVFLVLHDHDFKYFFLLPAREVRTGQVQGKKCIEVENTILLWKKAYGGWRLNIPHLQSVLAWAICATPTLGREVKGGMTGMLRG